MVLVLYQNCECFRTKHEATSGGKVLMYKSVANTNVFNTYRNNLPLDDPTLALL